MSKSALIKEKENLSKDKLIENLTDFFEKEGENNELVLKYNNKWIWFFFEDEKENIYDIEFSRDFEKKEILSFIEALRNKISYELLDIYVW